MPLLNSRPNPMLADLSRPLRDRLLTLEPRAQFRAEIKELQDTLRRPRSNSRPLGHLTAQGERAIAEWENEGGASDNSRYLPPSVCHALDVSARQRLRVARHAGLRAAK